MNKQLPASITKQQREAWDLVPWEGTINVEGDAAFEYFCQRLKWKLIDGADFRTWGVIGEKQDQITLLRRMQELGAIDAPDGEPELVCFPERIAPNGESYACSLMSEDDTEQIADFMRNCKVRGYYPVGGLIVLYAGDQMKHLNRLLKVPYLMHGTTRYIEVPVFVVNNADGWSDFSKAQTTTPSGIKRTIELIRADDVVPKSVEMLVPGFVVRCAKRFLR